MITSTSNAMAKEEVKLKDVKELMLECWYLIMHMQKHIN